jgi:hypothetical protein
MVDTRDLKSLDRNGRTSSSLVLGTQINNNNLKHYSYDTIIRTRKTMDKTC